MEYLSFLIAMIILYVILKLISLPMKLIIKLLLNAFIGGVILFLINIIGEQFGFTLEINWITSLILDFFNLLFLKNYA